MTLRECQQYCGAERDECIVCGQTCLVSELIDGMCESCEIITSPKVWEWWPIVLGDRACPCGISASGRHGKPVGV